MVGRGETDFLLDGGKFELLGVMPSERVTHWHDRSVRYSIDAEIWARLVLFLAANQMRTLGGELRLAVERREGRSEKESAE